MTGVQTCALPICCAAEEFGSDADSATWQRRSYALASAPARVNMRMRLRPIGREILDALVASGDLDPSLVDRFTTFEVAPTLLEWTPETATPSLGDVDYGSCVSSSPGCNAPDIRAP